MWKQRSDRWIMLLRNPLHIVLIFREALSHRLCCYRYIVSFSDSDKRDLVEEYSVESDKISLISNGLDLKQFRPPCDMERKELRQHFRIGNRCCLLFVGQEFNRKGLRYAIEALRLLPQEYMMLVAGRDERERRRYEHEFQDLIESGRLEFLGFVNNIHQLYHAVDIFVLPTVYETWALVGLEAMASGIPVLITSVNGVNEYLQPGFNGYFIERDANDIATKVRAVTETPAKYEHMAKGALATARKYDWFAITYKYLDLVRKVMTDQRKRNK
jgi:glycosyltransferase involved in cell wall biosynthesis